MDTLRYINIEFKSHKAALLQRISSRYPTIWNDFLNNSIGIVIVDLMAWSTATLAYIINRAAGENFISTMTLRESAVNIGSLVGYQLAGPVAATVTCEATIASPTAANITIAQGTTVRAQSTSTSIVYEVVKNYVIETGQISPVTPIVTISAALAGQNVLSTYCQVTNGSETVDLLDSTIDLTQYISAGQSFQDTDSSDPVIYAIQAIQAAPGAVANSEILLTAPWTGNTGIIAARVFDTRIQIVQGQTITDQFQSPLVASPSWAVQLSQNPVIDNSSTVTVNGTAWSQVFNFATSLDVDQVFMVQTFVDGTSAIIFGDGTFGALIPTNATVTATYRIGGGVIGNIPTGVINTSITGVISTTQNPVTITITNQTSAGMGGQDAETLEQARVNIPAYIRANDRAVTLTDYQTLASQYSDPENGAVSYAQASLQTQSAPFEPNIVAVYGWTTGSKGGLVNLSPQLKFNLQNYLQSKAVGTDYVAVFDGTSQPLPLALRFQAAGGYPVADVQASVTNAFDNFVNLLIPGQTVVYSDLLTTLTAVPGVQSVDIATPASDLVPDNSLQLFTVPQYSYVYSVQKNSVGTQIFSAPDNANISLYTAQLPVYPLAEWAFQLSLGPNLLVITPGILPNTAQVYGENVSINAMTDTVTHQLLYGSTVNLLTGQASLWIVGAPGPLTMQLVPIQGYAGTQQVDCFVSYTGDQSQTTRRQIRSALRSWGNSQQIGSSMFSNKVPGIIPSQSNVTSVVAANTLVTAVNRVALGTPSNTGSVDAIDGQVLILRNVVLNGHLD